jgi:hypothetical protein
MITSIYFDTGYCIPGSSYCTIYDSAQGGVTRRSIVEIGRARGGRALRAKLAIDRQRGDSRPAGRQEINVRVRAMICHDPPIAIRPAGAAGSGGVGKDRSESAASRRVVSLLLACSFNAFTMVVVVSDRTTYSYSCICWIIYT